MFVKDYSGYKEDLDLVCRRVQSFAIFCRSMLIRVFGMGGPIVRFEIELASRRTMHSDYREQCILRHLNETRTWNRL